ncbi:MAG TPA: dihydropteroate synthase [Candidatus Saccharimonadales bacterium]|nr:dihydropteroate synthase [Candidatus Saccharimonadales bacterium]
MVELVGILNVTPDSFSDGGQFLDAKAALARADELFAEGASLIDVGAESTRPNATPLTPAEEWQRLENVLPTLLKKYPRKISLDTYHPETVERAAALGPFIVNDVTGFAHPEMIAAAARHTLPCIISHLPNSAHGDAQAAHRGSLLDDINQVRDELLARKKTLEQAGITDIILDPGIGFGKTPELNRQLLAFAREAPDERVMIGYSRKRFLGEQRMELEPNLAAGRIAAQAGARYLRVHDVAGHHSLLA